MNVLEELKKKILLFDGGTGSLLQEAGLRPGELPETWNIRYPDIMVKLHRDYLEAGCDIIKTNTFGANRFKYNRSSEYGLKEIVTAAMEIARQAVREAGRGYIALDLGPTGKLLKPMGQLGFEEAVSVYREVVEIGAEQGADLILIETMSDTYELKAAVLAARETSALPVFATVIFDEKGKMLIAGTYTPVCLIVLGDKSGYSMLALVWGIALAGIIINALWINCPKWFSSLIYIAMGWVCVLAFKQIVIALPGAAFGWLLAGGIIYTVGGIIYALKLPIFNSRHKYFGSHEIFHLFVMGGSFCHYIMMYAFVA